MTPRGGVLYTLALAACGVEVNYPAVHPEAGTYLAVQLPGQQVSVAEAVEVNERLRADGHPVVVLSDDCRPLLLA